MPKNTARAVLARFSGFWASSWWDCSTRRELKAVFLISRIDDYETAVGDSRGVGEGACAQNLGRDEEAEDDALGAV